MSSRVGIGLTALLCGLVVAPPAAESKERYQEVELEESGTIVGTVSFDGSVPKPKKLEVTTEDQACHRGPIYGEDLVVSDDKKIKWAVASIKKIKQGKPFPKGPLGPVPARMAEKGSSGDDSTPAVGLDQNGCRFDPHVVLVPERQNMRLFNSDGILHNVHTYAKFNKPLNKSMPGSMTEMDVSFKRRERIRVKCDIHKWMGGWIVVAEHPYYAVTGSDGVFRLESVPVGTHKVEVWHETLGKQAKEVAVKAGAETRLEFVFKKK
jgi:plastocyanin